MDTEGQRKIQVAPMRREHLELVARIETECFSMPWSYESLEAEFANPLAVFLVAACGDEVVGYIGMTQVLDEGYIANLAVTGRMRRRGVARALLGRLVEHAREQELSFLTLEVRASNVAARSLYEQFGFEPAGTRRDFYAGPTEDAILMTREF